MEELERTKLSLMQSCEDENTVYLCREGSGMRLIFRDGLEEGTYDSELTRVLD